MDDTKAVIIIPTYNEASAIKNTIVDLERHLTSVENYSVAILVFDSASTDETQSIVRALQAEYSNLYLTTEQGKSGLGSAYIKAMKYAMHEMNADIVFEFDADGSHQPKYIPDMLALFDQGADVVVGSRYVKGGSIPKNWGWHRKALSVLGNWVARLFLTNKYKDMTSGFRGTRTAVLKKVNLDKLLSKNYAYKIHLFWALHKAKAKIQEYPIEFIDRQAGYSKFPKNNMIESLKVVILLRYYEVKRYMKVVFVGGIGALIQLTLFNILRHFFSPELANLVGVECAIISNFVLNNYISFRDQRFARSMGWRLWLRKMVKFNVISLGSLVVQVLIVFFGTKWLGQTFLTDNALVLMGIIIASLMNYKGYVKLIWKDASKA